jgi:regulation of enolase protein 1 (concanavalin A-like superfamily)
MKPKTSRIPLLSRFICLLVFLFAASCTRAQVVTNVFTNPNLDFVTNGVIGTGFTGVDLNSGDIPGGSGAGTSLAADSGSVLGVPGAGFLFVQTVNGGWAGTEDDGFFSFNVVWGDFDAYLDVTAPFDNQTYTFGGLMARAVSDGTGAPFNPTGTNANEDWMKISRFEEFGIPTQVRYASNGNDIQITVTNLYGTTVDTNADVFLRINRTGDVFSFYDSATYGGPWTLEEVITNNDVHGAAMQVGIEEGGFTANEPIITFTDFGISAANPYTPPTGDPSSVLVTDFNTNGSVDVSWTPGAGSDGSVVVITENIPMTQSPYYGFTYVGNSTVGSVVNMGGNQQVVYAGSGTNVTISGLFGNNDVYNLAVYSYTTNHGNTLITYDSAPATTSFNGPGVVVGISATVSPFSIPVNGVATVDVVANFSSGGTLDVTSGASVASSDPAIIASVAPINGGNALVLSATNVTTGTSSGNITVTYLTFSYTFNVTSHLPVFVDNFSAPHSYLTNGVLGTGWNGVYETGTDIAGGVDPTALNVTVFDADISSNNCLSISSSGGYWKAMDDNGVFLYNVVPGDFEASVHITRFNHSPYNFVGLLARAFSTDNNASPFGGTGGLEYNVNWQLFNQFGDSTVLFDTANGVTTETDDHDGETNDLWLLMTRVDATNFFLFQSATFGGPWTLKHSAVQPDLVAGTMLQVGLEQATYSGASGNASFDTFMLDGDGIVGPLETPSVIPTPASNVVATLTQGDSSTIITWDPGVVPPSNAPTSFVVMRAGSQVSSQPYFGDLTSANSIFGAGTDLGGGNFLVYRGGGNTVTVTGLTPGIQYYVVVYEYAGSSTTKAFNIVGGTPSETPPVVFTGITAVVSTSPSIPVNGIGGSYHVFASVEGTTNPIDVSASATLIATNGIVTGTDGIFTGLSVGTDSNVMFSFTPGNSTNTFVSSAYSVSVRAPSFSDNFSKPINYYALATNANGNPATAVTGTIWDGVFLGGAGNAPGGYSIPGGVDGGGQTTALDADITLTNTLSLIHQNDTWDGTGANDAFLLYKNVVGDFQSSVFISSMDQSNYQMSGIMARLANADGSAASGIGGVENFINQTEFEEFGFLDILRFDINGADDNFGTPPAIIPTNNGFLMVRTQGTNFTFYRRSSPTNAFTGPIASYTEDLSLFASTTNVVEVGPCSATYNAPNSGLLHTTFTQFMLDLTSGPTLASTLIGGNLTITWGANDSFQHLYSTSSLSSGFTLVPGAIITTVNGISSVTIPVGNGNEFFAVGR